MGSIFSCLLRITSFYQIHFQCLVHNDDNMLYLTIHLYYQVHEAFCLFFTLLQFIEPINFCFVSFQTEDFYYAIGSFRSYCSKALNLWHTCIFLKLKLLVMPIRCLLDCCVYFFNHTVTKCFELFALYLDLVGVLID